MTDARFPERWLNDRRVVRLSGQDFKSFAVALMWSVSNRTDGLIEVADLPLIPGYQDDSTSALVAAGLWRREGPGWLIVDFEGTQSSRAQLEGLDHRRAMDRERQARKRGKDSALSRDNPRDVTRDVQSPTKDRPGQDRQAIGSGAQERIDDLVTGEVLNSTDPWAPADVSAYVTDDGADVTPAVPLVPACRCGVHLRGPLEQRWGQCADCHRVAS